MICKSRYVSEKMDTLRSQKEMLEIKNTNINGKKKECP